MVDSGFDVVGTMTTCIPAEELEQREENLRMAKELASLLNLPSVRGNTEEWDKIYWQLGWLFGEEGTKEVAMLWIKGSATPAYEHSLKRLREIFAILCEMGMGLSWNAEVTASLVEVMIFIALKKSPDKMEGTILNLLEYVERQHIDPDEVCEALSRRLFLAMSGNDFKRQMGIVSCLKAISAKRMENEMITRVLADALMELGEGNQTLSEEAAL